jgi:hypothetical protein
MQAEAASVCVLGNSFSSRTVLGCLPPSPRSRVPRVSLRRQREAGGRAIYSKPRGKAWLWSACFVCKKKHPGGASSILHTHTHTVHGTPGAHTSSTALLWW